MKKPTTKTAKKAAKVAKKAIARAGKPPKAKKALNMLDKDMQALFLKNKSDFEKAIDKLGKAQAAVRSLGKIIKADGFTVGQIKFAIQCETPEGEAIAKNLIANNLLAAAYAGADIGEQLSMFLDTPRVPAVDRAFKEGESDAMQDRPAKPAYAPGTPQHASYMDGFHAATAALSAKRLKEGIKPLDSKLIKKSDKGPINPQSAPPTAAASAKPVLGRSTTHKDATKGETSAQKSARETADKYFKPTTPGVGNA